MFVCVCTLTQRLTDFLSGQTSLEVPADKLSSLLYSSCFIAARRLVRPPAAGCSSPMPRGLTCETDPST